MVSGWTRLPGIFVLHSVIRQRDALICCTPLPFRHEDWLDFIPDPNLTMSRDSARKYIFHRGGFRIDYGVRRDPDFITALWGSVGNSLAQGKHPQEIIRKIDRFTQENWRET